MDVLPAIVFAVIVVGAVRARHRLPQPAAVGHLLLDPDARLRADELQPRLFGADADHQWRDRRCSSRCRTRASSTCARRAPAPACPTASLLRHCRSTRLMPASISAPCVLIVAFFIAHEIFALALRHDAARDQVQPDAHELHRLQHPPLRAHRLRHLGHVCRARRRAAGGHRSAGRRRAHAVDRLGRSGADDHPRRRRHADRAGDRRRLIKYFENIFSSFNEGSSARFFAFLPGRRARTSPSPIASTFVGDGWQLTLGVLFVLVVVFLPGGIMEGVRRIVALFGRGGARRDARRHARPAGGVGEP